jgi:hypothetical protein
MSKGRLGSKSLIEEDLQYIKTSDYILPCTSWLIKIGNNECFNLLV